MLHNKLSINKCGVIRQVFVVWFNSGGDDASYHGVDSSSCRNNPIRSIDGSSPTPFLLYHCPPWNFQSKVIKMARRIHDTNPMKTWNPCLCIPCILSAHRTTICGMKHVYFYGLKSLFPMLVLLRAEQNVITPLEIIANSYRFKTTLLRNNRANTFWAREGWRIIFPPEPTPLYPT